MNRMFSDPLPVPRAARERIPTLRGGFFVTGNRPVPILGGEMDPVDFRAHFPTLLI